MHCSRWIAAAAFAVSLADTAQAQKRANVAVTGGMATDPRGDQRTAVSIAPGITVSRMRGTRVSLGAAVIQYRDVAWALAGGASGEVRRPVWKSLSFAASGNANAMRFNADSGAGTYSAADVRPTLELGVQNLTLFAGLRATAALASPESKQSGAGTNVGATFTSLLSQGETMRLTARQEHFKAGRVVVNDASAALVMITGRGSFIGHVGRRDASDEHGTFGDAGLAVHITPNLQFNASAGRYQRDRYTGIRGGNYVNVGFLFGPGLEMIGRSYLAPPAGG